ncbi:hypothetical protein EYF80_004398 [Liparis tanakae]|uniref:Uncharacterized protein n=1 Tax=Liparis tanakae TaxID=230148 RepID=A0A4Z2J5B9_9TELE|nr:hypothetical protein EYF80_004398 [Liparis tanakae]
MALTHLVNLDSLACGLGLRINGSDDTRLDMGSGWWVDQGLLLPRGAGEAAAGWLDADAWEAEQYSD